MPGKVTENGADHIRVATDLGEVYVDHGHAFAEGSQIWVALWPEKIYLTTTPHKAAGPNQIEGMVDDIGYLGETSLYKVRLANGEIIDVTAPNLIRPKTRTHGITWEDKVYLRWEPSSAMLLAS